jgi:hypothetical protein
MGCGVTIWEIPCLGVYMFVTRTGTSSYNERLREIAIDGDVQSGKRM